MAISNRSLLGLALSPALFFVASCGATASVDGTDAARSVSEAPKATEIGPFAVTEHGAYDQPWAAAFEPGTGHLFITEKPGTIKVFNPETGQIASVSGAPEVDYGGQGGLGEIRFAPDYATSKMVYLGWAEAGVDDTRGAAVGRGTLNCDDLSACSIDGLEVIWRQTPKTTGRGHYSHRIAFSPDGQYLFIASGDRQKMEPAQDRANTLGSIVRLNLEGTPAADNPFADAPAPTNQIWSYGHRNILGMDFDAEGRLWEVEHGPKGGDELNLVELGKNYGWPVVSDGIHYDNDPIPDNATRPELAQPAMGWTPVIAPGDMTFLRGDMFADWKGDLLITGLRTRALVHVKTQGTSASEVARYEFDNRLRGLAEGPDGAIWVLEDGEGARLLRLTPKR